MKIAEKIASLEASVREAAARAGRAPEEIRIVLATKGVSADSVREAFQAGIRDFGENRIQELLAKKRELPQALRWHMIGHLQTNKVRQVLGEVELIHSLDRAALAEVVEREAAKRKIEKVACLIQVKVSQVPGQGGFPPEEVTPFVARLRKDSPLSLQGLMAMGPLSEDREKIRRAFRTVKELQGQLKKVFPERDWGILSMGMSGDWPLALEEGATLIRIGTAVFGKR